MRHVWSIISSIAVVGGFVGAIVVGLDALRTMQAGLDAQGEKLTSLEQTIDSLPFERLPSGATVIEKPCVPANQRLMVAANNSYDVCDHDVTVFVEDIHVTRVDFLQGMYNPPARFRLADACYLELLSIPRADESSRQAEIRIRCDG